MSRQCLSVACAHRVVYSVRLLGCGKTFSTIHPCNELWKAFPPAFQPATLETAVAELVEATQNPEHVASFIAYQRKLIKQADEAAESDTNPRGVSRDILRVLHFLTTDCGLLWNDNPLQQLNGVLTRRFDNPDALHDAAHMIFLAHTSLNALPKVELKEGATLCWAALVPSDKMPQAMSKFKENAVVYSESYVSAVQSLQDLETIINASEELLSDFSSMLESHALVLFVMDVDTSDKAHLPVAHDISALGRCADPQTLLHEVLLDPGFEATVTSVSDGSSVSLNGIAVAKTVHLHFVQDTGFFAAVPKLAEKPLPTVPSPKKPLPVPKPREQPLQETKEESSEFVSLATKDLSASEKQLLNMLELLEEESDEDNACDLLSQILSAVGQEQPSAEFVIGHMVRVIINQFSKFSDSPDVALQTSLIILFCVSESDAIKKAVVDSGILDVIATLLTKFMCRADIVQACLAILVKLTSVPANCAHPQMAKLVPKVLLFVTSSSPRICEHAITILLSMNKLPEYSSLLSDNVDAIVRCVNNFDEIPNVCLLVCKVLRRIALDKQHRQSLDRPTVVNSLAVMLASNSTNSTVVESVIGIFLCITMSESICSAIAKDRVVPSVVSALNTFIESPRIVYSAAQLLCKFSSHPLLLSILKKNKAAHPLISVVALESIPEAVRSAAVGALGAIFKDKPCSCHTAKKLIPVLLKAGVTAKGNSTLKLEVIKTLQVLASDHTVALMMEQFQVDKWVIEMSMSFLGEHEYALAVATLFATLAEKNVLLARARVTNILLCLMNPFATVKWGEDEEFNILVWEQCCRALCFILAQTPQVIAMSLDRAFQSMVSLMRYHGMHPRLMSLEVLCFKFFQKLSLSFLLILHCTVLDLFV